MKNSKSLIIQIIVGVIMLIVGIITGVLGILAILGRIDTRYAVMGVLGCVILQCIMCVIVVWNLRKMSRKVATINEK